MAEGLSAGLRRVPPAGPHGGDGARLAAALGVPPGAVLDLSQSLNPCAGEVDLLAARRLDALRRYPDTAEATIALAVTLGTDPGQVVLTNGGSEAIALVAADVQDGWVEAPEFSLYTRHLTSVRPDAGRWRSNPRNPTGALAGADERAAVWDEAFWPLTTGTWTRGDAEQGAIVIGSLTKTFSCPGLRMGYVVCPDPTMAERLRARQPAWSVGALACALVPDLLDSADLAAWSVSVRVLRGQLADVLEGAGLAVEVADAPWVLVRGAGDLRARLAVHAILVRDCVSFGMRDTVRIGVPDEAGLDRLARALG